MIQAKANRRNAPGHTRMLAAALGLFAIDMAIAGSASAQAVVSHQQQITAGWTTSESVAETVRERRLLGVFGSNVQPLGGGSTFTVRSQWELREQGEPFRLSIIEINPEIRIDQNNNQFNSAYVQRSTSLYVSPSGRLKDILPDNALMPGETLTVFTDP